MRALITEHVAEGIVEQGKLIVSYTKQVIKVTRKEKVDTTHFLGTDKSLELSTTVIVLQQASIACKEHKNKQFVLNKSKSVDELFLKFYFDLLFDLA